MAVRLHYLILVILYQALYHCAGYAGHAPLKNLRSLSGARIGPMYAHSPFFALENGLHTLHTLHRCVWGVTVGEGESAIKNPAGLGQGFRNRRLKPTIRRLGTP